MIKLAFDCETHLIAPGMLFPKLVCVSIATPHSGSQLLNAADGLKAMRTALLDPAMIVIGHNVSFDLGVLCAEDPDLIPIVFAALEAGRIRDTMLRQQLLDIAEGVFKIDIDDEGHAVKHKYALADLLARHTGRFLKKEDTWRLHYAYLTHKPIAAWPEDAKQYALDDSTETLSVFNAQEAIAAGWGAPNGEIPDEIRQTRNAWALHLEAGWGLRTDRDMVAQLRAVLEGEQAEALKALIASGSGIVRPNGKRDMKALTAAVLADFAGRGEECPLTPTGRPKTGREILEQTSHPDLLILAEIGAGQKILSTYVPALERGIDWPLTSRPNCLVDSGRTSWGNPNLQNPPRKGGVRECFIARPGHVFCSVDYDTIELRALAQTCLEHPEIGWSNMATALEDGQDLHVALGAEMLGLDYAEAIKLFDAGDKQMEDARQSAKAANFGFPGGMGVQKFLWAQRELIKQMAIEKPLEWGSRLRQAWLRRWAEMDLYFQHISRLTAEGGDHRMIHPWSGRVRGGLDYCSAANSYFQGRTADGAKMANYNFSRDCYTATSGALRGVRPVLFLHDEVMSEMPEIQAAEAAMAKTDIMIRAMREVIPDVPITAKPVLMRRWYKGAKACFLDGLLVPSKPEVNEKGKTIWVPDF